MKDKIQGKAEELEGRVTGDDSKEFKGEARQKVGDAKDTARDIREDVLDDKNDR